jgi:hypothetical protein
MIAKEMPHYSTKIYQIIGYHLDIVTSLKVNAIISFITHFNNGSDEVNSNPNNIMYVSHSCDFHVIRCEVVPDL